ncbi:MAG: hypothetical protein J5967_05245 [Oscillospiraceae bacterium]|nr:hypothetical protein [Oscillospiraceae bacterium]
MSWEVRTMKSRISFFDRGVCRNLLKRSWPLWAAYLTVLLLELTVPLSRSRWTGGVWPAEVTVLQSGLSLSVVSMVMGVLAAMVLFGYLYSSRSCGMMSALPIRRETMFLTVYGTVLGAMLLADLLALGLTVLVCASQKVPAAAYGRWIAMAAMYNLCFYGIAVFCAMLTGSLVILPAVYVVLNMTATVAETCLLKLLEKLVYGLSPDRLRLSVLSPIAYLLQNPRLIRDYRARTWELVGMEKLVIYCAVGLLLSLAALLLYRRRRMETATDTVAIPILKPVFQYCMAFGTALVFASVVFSMLLGGSLHGRGAACVILVLLLVGAFLGYFIAAMLIRKTVRVFHRGWKGMALVWLVLLAGVLTAELDLFGAERFVPAAEQVESVGFLNGFYEEPENIRALTAYHRQLVEHRALHERDIHGPGNWVDFSYNLKNGKTLTRRYYLASDPGQGEGAADLLEAQRLKNLPEALLQRNLPSRPVTAERLRDVTISAAERDQVGGYTESHAYLTPEEGYRFYTECLLPDLLDGRLGQVWLVSDDEYRSTLTTLTVGFHLLEEGTDPRDPSYEYRSYTLTVNAERCLDYVRQNTDLPVLTVGQVDFDETPLYPETVWVHG